MYPTQKNKLDDSLTTLARCPALFSWQGLACSLSILVTSLHRLLRASPWPTAACLPLQFVFLSSSHLSCNFHFSLLLPRTKHPSFLYKNLMKTRPSTGISFYPLPPKHQVAPTTTFFFYTRPAFSHPFRNIMTPNFAPVFLSLQRICRRQNFRNPNWFRRESWEKPICRQMLMLILKSTRKSDKRCTVAETRCEHCQTIDILTIA